ncbi:unnamed protein product [[Candida] boidinii]|uniref:Unnamed protein product n=1 Tax=Candida boidinii TaxID=5477 RepID=A0A9W6T3U0_CANBO|nr:hypothetical protein B5S30_g4692 [[Candida] boidinii]OWB86595.1 hypothetical protein B5S33_g5300 [[Candida] boidinii]GME75536.1 unnamed protein product [[Candida] boidinii]
MLRNVRNTLRLLANVQIGKLPLQTRSLSTASEFLKTFKENETQDPIKKNGIFMPLPKESIEDYNLRCELQLVQSVKENLQESLVSAYTTESPTQFKRFRKVSLWAPFKFRTKHDPKSLLKFTSPKFEDINTCEKIENYLLLISLAKFQPNDDRMINKFIYSLVFKAQPDSDLEINNKIFNLPPVFRNIKTLNYFLLFFVTRKDLDSALTIYYNSGIMDKNCQLAPSDPRQYQYNPDESSMKSHTINILLKLNSIVNLSNLNFNNLKFTQKLITDILEVNSLNTTAETFLLIYLNLQNTTSKITYLNWLRENDINLNLFIDSNHSTFKDLCIINDKLLLKELETTKNLQLLNWLK